MSDISFPDGFVYRAAVPDDVDHIHALLADYAADRLLLPRTKEDLLSRIGNFHVVEMNGEFAGCTALRNYGGGLHEVRSLAIRKEFLERGVGSAMVASLLAMLRSRSADTAAIRVFALTYREHFFHRLGFHTVNKEMFPEKIWSDCSICPKKDHCDEIAVLLELPLSSSTEH